MNQVIKTIRVFAIILLILFGIYHFVNFTLIMGSGFYASNDFCEESGYDTLAIRGTYVPYKNKDYGRIKCYSFYADGNEEVEFNVKRNWRGKLALVEVDE